ncbi:MAG: peptidoglycan DD-metalloendopeptidase family protein [Patescibacteria group bacterium]|jgi:murein DD-endopeptidase MepM/ murein hydrolase activator NlpD
MKQVWKKIIVIVLALVCISTSTFAYADVLEDKQLELKALQKKIEEQEAALNKVKKQRLTLDNQVKIIDQQIEAAQLTLQALGSEIEVIGLEKGRTNKELVDLEEQAMSQKLILQKAIRAAYLARREGIVEILLTSSSMADLMTRIEYLDRVQNHISVGIKTLTELKQGLAAKKAVLEDKDKHLEQVRQSKAIEEQSLQIQMDTKTQIVSGLKMSESEYQQKLAESKAQQQAVANEVAAIIRGSGKKIINPGDLKLRWPIAYRTITAGFRDADYAKMFGMAHNAIDVGCPQGTPIKSPYNGTVAKVVDGGAKGLSYMVVNHDNGMSTVYLHLSGFAASAGAYVVEGQTIGYTGGTPGTAGAGWMTTGPHLHFEVWLNGQATNPLAYLID